MKKNKNKNFWISKECKHDKNKLKAYQISFFLKVGPA